MKKLLSTLLACALVFGCTALPVSAAESFDEPPVIARVTGRVNQSIPSKMTVYLAEFTLAEHDTIQYDCTYTPTSASVDFGYVGPDGKFHYLNRTDGSVNKTFEVSTAGTYTLAVRNNSSYTVTVTGTVKY